MGHFTCLEGSCIVAAAFEAACAARSHTVELTGDADIGAAETGLEVRAYGGNHNHKQVFVGCLHTDTRSKADFERTDIERRTAAVGGHEVFVELYGTDTHLAEEVFGHRLHEQAFGRFTQTTGIFFQTEDTDFAVGTTKCLEAFKDFLAIMQCCGRDMDV